MNFTLLINSSFPHGTYENSAVDAPRTQPPAAVLLVQPPSKKMGETSRAQITACKATTNSV